MLAQPESESEPCPAGVASFSTDLRERGFEGPIFRNPDVLLTGPGFLPRHSMYVGWFGGVNAGIYGSPISVWELGCTEPKRL